MNGSFLLQRLFTSHLRNKNQQTYHRQCVSSSFTSHGSGDDVLDRVQLVVTLEQTSNFKQFSCLKTFCFSSEKRIKSVKMVNN